MDLPKVLIQDEVRRALRGPRRAGDLSLQATIDPETIATGLFVARDAGGCGLPHAALAFEALDSGCSLSKTFGRVSYHAGHSDRVGIGGREIHFIC